MTDKNDYDAEFQPTISGSGGLRWISLLVVVLIIVGFFSLVWYAYNTSLIQQQETIAVIGAPREHFKEKPEDAGGLDVQHQDIQSYQLMRRDASLEEELAQVERLLPAGEKPVLPKKQVEPVDESVEPKPEQTLQKPVTHTGAPEQLLASAARKKEQQEKVVSSIKTVQPVIEPITPQKPEKEAVTKASTSPPKSVPKKEVPTKATASAVVKIDKRVYIQFAALRSEAEAERSWKKISSRHADLLQGLYHYIESVSIAGKGTFYRLRAKGFASKKAADAICKQLKGRRQDCLVSR